jgi:hypothetical protein
MLKFGHRDNAMRRVIHRTVTTIKIVSVTVTSDDDPVESVTTTTDEQTVLVEGDALQDTHAALEIEPPASSPTPLLTTGSESPDEESDHTEE